jgi:uncharacterized protein YbjT (DUF2867 family)
MKVLIFGATGMVGQGVLKECIRTKHVQSVVTIGRTATGAASAKVNEIVHADLENYSGLERRLIGFDACFFCLGISSSLVRKTEYERVTYDITIAAAETLCRLNPKMTFIYVSGSGTDSSEQGRMRWARVKGRTENALLRLPFKAYMFRPGFIEPMDGIRSKTRAYRIFYMIGGPVLSLIRRALPNMVLSTRDIGQAMLAVARKGPTNQVLEAKDIRSVLQGN